ncbi:MAG: MBL fold metallo-hydrolase [Gammaproteobacteria bacterium]|nr:MBL fold metallo-hydrolase [Gammaproteobacteria bacterium]
MLIFRQLFDQESSTYTYLLGDGSSGEAVIIDPVFEQIERDTALLRELGLTLRCVVDTHCHADHVTSAWLLKQRSGAAIGISAHSGVDGADRYLAQGDRVAFGERYLEVRETPGHTDGCVTYVLDDESMAFTGDALMIRSCGRTDFQQGDPARLYRSVWTQILSLPEQTRLYPAHDYNGLTMTSVGEEKRFNPRLGGDIAERDFVGYMANLGLPHPRKIDLALPANLKCGRPADGSMPEAAPSWAPLRYTFAGIWEIEPQSLEEIGDAVQVVDVREADEFDGPLGHIEGARLIPLGTLSERLDEIDRERPVVAVCRAGGRSAHATVVLKRAGISAVANLAGGMLRWRAQGHPVVGGTDA